MYTRVSTINSRPYGNLSEIKHATCGPLNNPLILQSIIYMDYVFSHFQSTFVPKKINWCACRMLHMFIDHDNMTTTSHTTHGTGVLSSSSGCYTIQTENVVTVGE